MRLALLFPRDHHLILFIRGMLFLSLVTLLEAEEAHSQAYNGLIWKRTVLYTHYSM